jgi:hypothetical protein
MGVFCSPRVVGPQIGLQEKKKKKIGDKDIQKFKTNPATLYRSGLRTVRTGPISKQLQSGPRSVQAVRIQALVTGA